ncbi:DUF222 domain-containing protein [Rhodococcus daqingensis]|uniref:DUF222 domain-containing protein n=1 Tax=Rhodococcus daqingensis TaxID=2479363 RepID=A0ABW2RSM1_9NOCA
MDLAEMIADPRGVAAWQLDERELLALVPELSKRMRQLEALRTRLSREVITRSALDRIGASSAQAWLAGSSKLVNAHAKRILSVGNCLERFPDVGRAFDAGDIDLQQARTIIDLLEKIPDYTADIRNSADGGVFDDPAAECTRQCTDHLLAHAARENAEDTTKRAAALTNMLKPDGALPPDDENDRLNEFFASRTAGGRVRVKGHFDKTTGEQLMTALSALSKPQPGRNNVTGDPEPDQRSAPQRRADAFADIIRHYLDSGDAPGEGGEKPHMTVIVGLGDLANATRKTHGDNDRDGSSVHSDEEPGTRDEDEIESGNARGGVATDAAGPDERSFIRSGPAGGPPWTKSLGAMPWLGPISTRLANLLSCDASITPIAMDEDGNPLDVGHTTRTIPRRLRRALDARDCGCAFPGCGRPAAWTDGHPPPSTSCRAVPPSVTGP